MRKILAAVVAAGVCLTIGVTSSNAIPLTNKKAVGWFDPAAPIGGAYWFNEKVGVQVGIGFEKFNPPGPDDPDTDVRIAAAVPIRLAGPESCHFLFRPGILYEKNPSFDTSATIDNVFAVRADLAVEYFLSHRFSIVGGSGLEYRSTSPKVGDSTTEISARPISLASVGMYFYFGPDEK